MNLAGSDRDQLVDPMATFRRLALRPRPKIAQGVLGLPSGHASDFAAYRHAIIGIVVARGTTSIRIAGSWRGGVRVPVGALPAVETMWVKEYR